MYRLLCVTIAILIALSLAVEAQKSQEGDKFLSEGKYAQAIEAYTTALEADQRDSKILNKRAQAFYLHKQFKSALGDLEKIVDLSTSATASSDLLQAYLLKGKTNLLLGNFEQSIKDYEQVLSLKPAHQEAQSQIGVAQKALKQTERYIKMDSKEQDKQILNKCIIDLGEVISTVASESIPLRLQKAECALQLRLFPIVQEEVKRVIARDRRNMNAVLLNSQTMYKLGAVDIALKSLKDFLKTDPDNQKIQRAYKEIKKNEQMLEKANQKMESRSLGDAIQLFKQYLDNNPDAYNVVEISSKICKAYQELGNESDKCIEYCTKTIDLSTGSEESGVGENFMDALLNRAECHIQKDDLERAQQDANQAQQKGNSNRVHELLHKIQRLQRMASRKDHYKVLGLTKGATKDEIKKSYRKLSKMYHPDLATESKKQEMEKKFKEVTEAYEILSDDDKRRRYDSGEDMDQQQGDHGFGGGHPFFRQGGGGGGGFTFHFGGGGGGFPF